jgi:transposase
MKALTISDKENMIMALQDEIRRNDASRYDHRLHGVLLVAQGMTCPKVAELLGDSPRSVVNWVQRFETDDWQVCPKDSARDVPAV